jgi:hypothetical protein
MLRGCTVLGRLRGAAASYASISCVGATMPAVRGGGDAAAPAAAGWLRGFAVPSHMPDPEEKWPEGRRAPEGHKATLLCSYALT